MAQTDYALTYKLMKGWESTYRGSDYATFTKDNYTIKFDGKRESHHWTLIITLSGKSARIGDFQTLQEALENVV